MRDLRGFKRKDGDVLYKKSVAVSASIPNAERHFKFPGRRKGVITKSVVVLSCVYFSCLVVVKSVLIIQARIGVDVLQLPLIVSVLVVLFQFCRKPIALHGFTNDFEREIEGCVVAIAFVFYQCGAVIGASIPKENIEFFIECAENGLGILVYKFRFK